MSFTLPDLPYSHDALENLGMSKETLNFIMIYTIKRMLIMGIN